MLYGVGKGGTGVVVVSFGAVGVEPSIRQYVEDDGSDILGVVAAVTLVTDAGVRQS